MKQLILLFVLLLMMQSCTKPDFVIIANGSQFQVVGNVLIVSVLQGNGSMKTYQTADKRLIKKGLQVIEKKSNFVECGIVFEEVVISIK